MSDEQQNDLATAEENPADDEATAAAEEGAISQAPIDDLNSEEIDSDADPMELDGVLDIPVTLSVEIGQTRLSIRNLLKLNQGSVVELDRLAGEPLDVLINGTLVAHGEVVVVNERFGIRLTDVVSAQERVKQLG